MTSSIQLEVEIPDEFTLHRLDQAVAKLFPEYSRSRLQQWIKSGALTVNGKPARPRDKLAGGELIQVQVEEEGETAAAEDIPLQIVFEDDHILIVDKPVGLIVHPGAGNPNGTLLNALLNHDECFAHVPRAGIVHRLDRGTSGLMVVAKSLTSQNHLVKEIQARKVTRIYDAFVYGVLNRAQGSIEGAISRHPTQRKKMAIRFDGKPARTHYRVLEQFAEHALVECRLETGRTHQIRVHMQSLGYPLIGDPTYGGHFRMPRSGDEALEQMLRSFDRPALHAKRLMFRHPVSGKEMRFKSPYPDDLADLVALLFE
jgi:23S rRNA pseudouridine1911/1915/1917 synthase